MKVLQLVKFFEPSQGGIESVVKSIVRNTLLTDVFIESTVYTNSHVRTLRDFFHKEGGLTVITKSTLFFFRSQPLNFFFWRLRKLLVNSDVIHHHYPYPNIEVWLSILLIFYREKRFVITWHASISNSRWSFIEPIYNLLIKQLLSRADSIVVTSPQLLENSPLLLRFKSKVVVIPLCFNSEFASGTPRLHPRNRVFRLLFVGRLRRYKGLDYLIEAVADLSNAELTIVGGGEELGRLTELIKKLKLEERVTIETNIQDKDLVRFYTNSDVFVLPSINEAEAFGVVQLEAMASGIPVINTRLKSGVPYVSVHNETGFTVPPKDVEALSRSINELICSKELYETFSRNALDRSILFSSDKMVEGYIDLYHR